MILSNSCLIRYSPSELVLIRSSHMFRLPRLDGLNRKFPLITKFVHGIRFVGRLWLLFFYCVLFHIICILFAISYKYTKNVAKMDRTARIFVHRSAKCKNIKSAPLPQEWYGWGSNLIRMISVHFPKRWSEPLSTDLLVVPLKKCDVPIIIPLKKCNLRAVIPLKKCRIVT